MDVIGTPLEVNGSANIFFSCMAVSILDGDVDIVIFTILVALLSKCNINTICQPPKKFTTNNDLKRAS